jgi:hypothetical protein
VKTFSGGKMAYTSILTESMTERVTRVGPITPKKGKERKKVGKKRKKKEKIKIKGKQIKNTYLFRSYYPTTHVGLDVQGQLSKAKLHENEVLKILKLFEFEGEMKKTYLHLRVSNFDKIKKILSNPEITNPDKGLIL